MMNAKETLTEWLADGDLERVIAGLRVINKRVGLKDLASDINFQSGRYKDLKSNHLKGLVSHADYSIELAKIRQSLQDIVEGVAEHWTAEGLDTVPKARLAQITTGRWWKKWLSTFVLLAGIAGVVGYVIIELLDDSMQLTVYVQDTEGKPIPALQNSGHIIVPFDNDLRDPVIGENGRINIGEIPTKFQGQEIGIVLVAEGWELVDAGKKYKMDGKPVVLAVRRDNSLGTIQGIVKDRSGEHFIAGALVMIDQDTTVATDSLGRFRLVLPPSRQRETYSLTVKKEGFKVKNEYYKPKSGAIEIRLEK